MKGPKVSAPNAEAESDGQSSKLSPGMAALLQPGAPVSVAEASRTSSVAGAGTSPAPLVSPEVRTAKWIFRGSLFFADLLLVVLAGWLILKSDQPLTWAKVTLCILAVAMGAWLTCLAIWWERKRNKTSQ